MAIVRRLTDEQLAELALAALVNARRLYDDAALLRRAGRVPSAFVLLGLAADELGKHMLVIAFPTRGDSDSQWKKFWRRMNSHEEKLGNTLLAAWMFDPFDIDDPPDRSAFHQRRLAATYADIRNEVLETPTEMIDAPALDSAFRSIGQHLEYCERILVHTDARRLSTTMRNARESASKAPGADGARNRHYDLAVAMATAYGANEEQATHFASVMADQLPGFADGALSPP